MKSRPPRKHASSAPGRTNQPPPPRNRRAISPSVKPALAQPLVVEIEKPIYGGAFLARLQGKAVFVPLTLPGEQASVRITEQRSGYATAEAEEILAPATDRTQPPCPYFGPCGGCQYQHADYPAQLRFKQAILRETLERAQVQPPGHIDVLSAGPWAYRNRIRLAFDAHGNPGYRGRRSHQVVPIDQCPISAPLLIKAAREFGRLIRVLAPAFRPEELALFCNNEESALLVSVFAGQRSKLPREKFDLLASALKDHTPSLSGMELAVEGRPGQPPRTLLHWGTSSLTYRAAGFDYRVDHGAFFQINRWLVDQLVASVMSQHRGARAWDLFAGVGLFARQLTASFNHVVAVESAPTASAALALNLAGTNATIVPSSTLEFLRRNLPGRRPDMNAPDLIVVDPPRTGLGPETTSLLNAIAAPAITYVSCDPATLARDLRALLAGGYAIQQLTLADLFPQTFHLESVVQLARVERIP